MLLLSDNKEKQISERYSWLCLLLVVLVFGTKMFLLIGLNDVYFIGKFYMADDAFYYFKVAQNISQGYGSTFDGINVTNGYHPMWLVFILPIYWIFGSNPLFPLKIIYVLQGGLILLSSLWIYQSIRRLNKFAALVTIGLFLTNPFAIYILFNGMESALAFCIFSFIFHMAMKNRLEFYVLDTNSYIGIIVCCLAAFLFTRLEAGIFALFWIGTSILILNHRNMLKNRKIAMRLLILVTALSILIVGYVALNFSLVGLPMPISGLIKAEWGWENSSQDKLEILDYHLESYFSFLMHPISRLLTILKHQKSKNILGLYLFIAILYVSSGVWFFLSQRTKNHPKKMKERLLTVSPFIMFVVTFVMLCVFVSAGGYRYYAWPALFLGILSFFLFLIALLTFAKFLASQFKMKCIYKFLHSVLIGLVIISMIFSVKNSLRRPTLLFDWYMEDVLIDKAIDFTHDHIPEEDMIAGVSIGIYSYFSGRKVEHLEGLINGREFYEALRSGSVKEYLVKHNTKWLMYTQVNSGDFERWINRITDPQTILQIWDVASFYGIGEELNRGFPQNRDHNVFFVQLKPSLFRKQGKNISESLGIGTGRIYEKGHFDRPQTREKDMQQSFRTFYRLCRQH